MNRRDVLKLAAAVSSITVVPVQSSMAQAEGKAKGKERMTLATKLTRSYSVTHPVVCAGMGMICDEVGLGVAVAKSGAIGAIAGSLLSPPVLKQRIGEMRAATDGVFHINFLSLFPHDAQLQVCIEEKVPVVSFHFGVPGAPVISMLQEAGISVWVQVGSLENATKALQDGADALVVQGNEAGGHTYAGMPLMALLPAVREIAADSLLVAAGGIADGRGVAAAIAAGADGVMLGTRLVASHEANAHTDYKQRLLRATGEDTVITHVYGPEFPAFNPMRVIRNDTINQWEKRIDELPHDRSHLETIGKTMFAGQEKEVKPFDSIIPVRETTGDFEQMPMLAGQGVGLVDEIESAGAIIERIMDESARVIAAIQQK